MVDRSIQGKEKIKLCLIKFVLNYLMHTKEKGSAIKKKEDTHRMAESNKAFAHFRW